MRPVFNNFLDRLIYFVAGGVLYMGIHFFLLSSKCSICGNYEKNCRIQKVCTEYLEFQVCDSCKLELLVQALKLKESK